MKNDVICLKNDVKQLMESTDTILAAVNGLSSQLETCVSGLQDQINALSKQVKSRDKTLSDAVDTLTSATNKIKTSIDEKSNKILNKTSTIIEKVKSQTEIVETAISDSTLIPQKANTKKDSCVSQSLDTTKSDNNPDSSQMNTNKTEKKPQQTRNSKYKNVMPNSQAKNKSDQRPNRGHNTNPNILDNDETIDLTTDSKKKINQPTLLLGSSILKGIKNRDLKSTATVRSFSGARADTICDSISKYDITSCKTIVLHVGGNDADSGVDITTFSNNYVSLLNNLDAENRRIIVSGLLPRESVDLKPFNQTLKDICNENDIEFIDNYDSFLLASGEMPDSYFHPDKLHLKVLGTQKLLSNFEKVQSVRSSSKSNGDQTFPSNGPRHKGNTVVHKRKMHGSTRKFCHICSMNGHFTRDCWYNGRSMPQAVYNSW